MKELAMAYVLPELKHPAKVGQKGRRVDCQRRPAIVGEPPMLGGSTRDGTGVGGGGGTIAAIGWCERMRIKEDEQHGFIGSQKEGMQVFATIDRHAPLIVAEAVWQYSHHVLHGLITHRGPILTVANWSGTWPGLVGMLNLNGSLTKAGVKYSTLWGEDFSATQFRRPLQTLAGEGQAAASDGTRHALVAR